MSERRPYVPTNRDLAKTEDAERHGTRRTDRPEPGFYAWRFIKGAVEVGAEIRYEPTRDPFTQRKLDRSWYWAAIIDGKPDPNPSPRPSETVWSVYTFGRRIEEDEYRHMLSVSTWARRHAQHLPEANPKAPVDLTRLPLPF